MPHRWTYIRKVDPRAGEDTQWRPLSLWNAALAAADETIQGSPSAPAWLQLFRAHLNDSTDMLQWRGNLGESGDMRRAYSALYGRYFARAVLTAELGITDFLPLNTDTTRVPGGVTVSRITKGDIPDWIAWDPRARCHVLCEAKGRMLPQNRQFLHGKPGCINDGKAQLNRVEVTDSRGRRIATRDWIAASLWSTDKYPIKPVTLLWDPPGGGESLSREEAEHHAQTMRWQRDANIATRLGNPEFVVEIAIDPTEEDMGFDPNEETRDGPSRFIEHPSPQPHAGEYLAAVITGLGVQPIRNEDDLQRTRAASEYALETGEPAMIFGLAKTEPRASLENRELEADLAIAELQGGQSLPGGWLSANGIASPDGLSLFDLRDVRIS